jgi:hypothetical protein
VKRTLLSAAFDLGVVVDLFKIKGKGKVKIKIKGSGQECPLHTSKKEKAIEISLNGLYLMPATTYSPTHFRVQYHRPSGA